MLNKITYQAEEFYSLNEEVAAAAAAATDGGDDDGEASNELATYSLPSDAAEVYNNKTSVI